MHYCLKRGVMYMYTPPETCVAMQRKLRNTTLFLQIWTVQSFLYLFFEQT